jgi:hypothetical protein
VEPLPLHLARPASTAGFDFVYFIVIIFA